MNTPLSCLFILFLGLVGCTAAQQQSATVQGQLFCDAAGAPIIVSGMASATVAALCAQIAAIPVTPPPVTVAVPVVAVTVPAAG